MYKKQMTILLIEDNPGDVRLVQLLLHEALPAPLHLITAGRLAEGLARLAEGGIDLILLDLSLPDSQGVATVTRLLAYTNRLPVVVLTGLHDEGRGLEAVQAGAQDYLVKGEVDAPLLSHALRYAIERQRLLVERDLLIADLDAFAHTVAHDLKAPLGPIMGYTQLLKMDGTTPEQVRLYAGKAEQSDHRMNHIIQDLLLLANVRQNHVATGPLDMGPVVAAALARLEHLIEEYEAEIITPAYWPPSVGYAPWVEAVWVNYISNAIKYGGCPPRIELGATETAEGIFYWIRDNGPGIEPAAQARLFNPFTRVGQLQLEGHGLGLSIVQRIVEKLEGQVGVESLPNQGSRFYFALPGVPAGSHYPYPAYPYQQAVLAYAEVA